MSQYLSPHRVLLLFYGLLIVYFEGCNSRVKSILLCRPTIYNLFIRFTALNRIIITLNTIIYKLKQVLNFIHLDRTGI